MSLDYDVQRLFDTPGNLTADLKPGMFAYDTTNDYVAVMRLADSAMRYFPNTTQVCLLTTNQTVAGIKTFSDNINANGGITIPTTKNLIMQSDSDILVNTDKFTVAGSTGNTVVGGTLAVGAETYAASSVADDFIIQKSDNIGMSIITHSASQSSSIFFGHGATTNAAAIQYNGTMATLSIRTQVAGDSLELQSGDNVDGLIIDADQNVSISNGNLTVVGNLNIGSGAASVDPTITITGETNSFLATWKEDEDHLQIDDALYLPSGTKLHFGTPGGASDSYIVGDSYDINIYSATGDFTLEASDITLDAAQEVIVDIGGTVLTIGSASAEFTIPVSLTTNRKITFRDSAIGIFSQADTFLDIFADGAVRIGGDGSVSAPTDYTSIDPTGNISFTGGAGFYPRTLNQSGEPAAGTSATQLDTSELCIWTDTDDSKCYLCFNHGGTVKTVELT